MHKQNTNSAGFTIVELLIVIVVIAILAAISVVAYTGIQERTHTAAIQSDLSNLSKRFELFYVDNGRYPNQSSDLDTLGFKPTKTSYLTSGLTSNLVTCYASGSQEYSIAAVLGSGKRLYATKGGVIQEFTGSETWLGTNNYISMCSTSLPGSSNIGNGAGFANGSWRPWTGI